MIIYRIYVIPNEDLSGTCIGVIYDVDQNLFNVKACRKGPNFKYDSAEKITTLELDDDFIEASPDDGIASFKERKRIRINSSQQNPESRIVGEMLTINFDTTKEKFLKYFNLKDN